MEIFNFLTLVASLLLLCGTDALLSPHTRLSRSLPSRSLLIPEVTWSSPTYNATFQQYIDHSNPALGTFSQRYWYNAEFWGGPGYPVVFSNSGEENGNMVTGLMNNRSLWGVYAQELKAVIVMLEHRYWGESSPYDIQNTETLQYLTIDQTIADFVNFAQTAELAFDTNSSSNAQNAPWVFVGGSYSAMLAAWTGRFHPGVFWAFHAMSAPVEIIHDFWEYWVPVQEGMPQNCSADFQRVVAYVDETINSGNQTAVDELKNLFGLGDLEYNDDFVVTLESGLGYWEQIQFVGGTGPLFYTMCDAIEGATGNVSGSSIPPHGVGLRKALPNYAAWIQSRFLYGLCQENALILASNLTLYESYLPPTSVACLDTHNLSSLIFIDQSPLSVYNRRWAWLGCNEPTFWAWKVAPPTDQASIISRLITTQYYDDFCARLFPPVNGFTYGLAKGRSADMINDHTGGWDYTNTTRLIWSNGEQDPWRTESVSSPYRPGGPLRSTVDTPTFVIPGAWHCSDLYVQNGEMNADVKAVQDQEVAIIAGWVIDYYALKNGTASS